MMQTSPILGIRIREINAQNKMKLSTIDNIRDETIPDNFPPLVYFNHPNHKPVLVDPLGLGLVVCGQDVDDG